MALCETCKRVSDGLMVGGELVRRLLQERTLGSVE